MTVRNGERGFLSWQIKRKNCEHEEFSFPSVRVLSDARVHLSSAAAHVTLLRVAVPGRKSKRMNHVTTGDEGTLLQSNNLIQGCSVCVCARLKYWVLYEASIK